MVLVIMFIACSTMSTTVVRAAKSSDPPPDPGGELAGYQNQLVKVMDEVFRVEESIQRQPNLSEEAKKQKGLEFLRNVRWGPEKKDNFWANDMQGRMLMDPYIPSLEGKIMLGYEDPSGSRPFAEFVRIGEENGEGFHEYEWPKYEGRTPVPRRAFVRLFEPWGWIIGTGVYVDVIEAYEDPEPLIYYIPSDPPDPPDPPDPDPSIPEPSTILLFGMGIFGMAGVKRRKT